VSPFRLAVALSVRGDARAVPRRQRAARAEQGAPRRVGPRLVRKRLAACGAKSHSRPRRRGFREALALRQRPDRAGPRAQGERRQGGAGEHAPVPARPVALRAQRHLAAVGRVPAARRGADRSVAARRLARRDRQRALLPSVPHATAEEVPGRCGRDTVGRGRAGRDGGDRPRVRRALRSAGEPHLSRHRRPLDARLPPRADALHLLCASG
jgi:hypothetical protein